MARPVSGVEWSYGVSAVISLFNYFSYPFAITHLICCETTKAEMTHFWRHWLFENMPFTKEHKILIKNLFELKGYTAKQLVREFPSKGQNVGRQHSAHTADNIDLVSELALSQEDKPQSHRTVREISRETGIHRSSVNCIIHKDLHLKCLKKRHAQQLSDTNCKARLQRSRMLLQKFPDHAADFISDQKVFTIASPVNLQNDRVYTPSNAKKASYRQRIDALLRRAKRCGYYDTDLPLFEELCDNADEQLFNNIQMNSFHSLHSLLPPESSASQNYTLRTSVHNRQLPDHTGHLDDSNFITRMLFKNIY